jgi:hypothetical protein
MFYIFTQLNFPSCQARITTYLKQCRFLSFPTWRNLFFLNLKTQVRRGDEGEEDSLSIPGRASFFTEVFWGFAQQKINAGKIRTILSPATI